MPDAVADSVEQFYLAWKVMAERAAGGFCAEDEQVLYAIVNVPIALFNGAFARAPVRDLPSLRRLAAGVVERFRKAGVSGMLMAPDNWLPAGGPEVLQELGFTPQVYHTGMQAASLLPPVRPLPECDLHEVSGTEAARMLAVVNEVAYGMTPGGADLMVLPDLWRAPVSSYAVFEGSDAVAVGASVMQKGTAYIMWMATLPEFQRRGYAEAIIRRAMADAGNPPTALHASRAGLPIYARMGYVPVGEFVGYIYNVST